jgi:hypothetical protein
VYVGVGRGERGNQDYKENNGFFSVGNYYPPQPPSLKRPIKGLRTREKLNSNCKGIIFMLK